MIARQLIAVLLALQTINAQDGGISVTTGENQITVEFENFPDPCVGYVCGVGEECVAIYHPSLLPFPVAHCRQSEEYTADENGPCVQFSVGSNVMSCKTVEQWRQVGGTQCVLRSDSATQLDNTEVAHACHSFTGSSKYLLATFTCCPKQQTVTMATTQPSPSPPHYEADETPLLVVHANTSYRSYLVPIVLGGVALTAIVLFVLAIRHRRRSNSAQSKLAKPDFATSFVNPNSEGWEDGAGWEDGDKSVLIANPSSM